MQFVRIVWDLKQLIALHAILPNIAFYKMDHAFVVKGTIKIPETL
jgi:hypothetical protein